MQIYSYALLKHLHKSANKMVVPNKLFPPMRVLVCVSVIREIWKGDCHLKIFLAVLCSFFIILSFSLFAKTTFQFEHWLLKLLNPKHDNRTDNDMRNNFVAHFDLFC